MSNEIDITFEKASVKLHMKSISKEEYNKLPKMPNKLIIELKALINNNKVSKALKLIKKLAENEQSGENQRTNERSRAKNKANCGKHQNDIPS